MSKVEQWKTAISNVLTDFKGKIPAVEMWKIIGEVGPTHRIQDNRDIREVTAALGWEPTIARFRGKLMCCYIRGSKPLASIILIRDNLSNSYTAQYLPPPPKNANRRRKLTLTSRRNTLELPDETHKPH